MTGHESRCCWKPRWPHSATGHAQLGAAHAAAARRTASLPDRLTAREAEVLGLLAAGRTNKEIAAQLVLSPATVERHVANLYPKIGARRRAEAATCALKHDLLPSHTR